MESLQEVVVSLVLEPLPVTVFLREVGHPSYQGVAGIGDVAKDIKHLEHKF